MVYVLLVYGYFAVFLMDNHGIERKTKKGQAFFRTPDLVLEKFVHNKGIKLIFNRGSIFNWLKGIFFVDMVVEHNSV